MTGFPLRAAVVAMCLAAGSAWAQEVPLTLHQALDAALERNASLRAARFGRDEAAARVPEARADYFPRITVSEQWRRGDEPVFVFGSLLSARRFTAASFAIDALNHPDPVGFFRASVTVDQVLFDGGRRAAALRAAKLRQQMADDSTDEAAAALVVRVTGAFGRALAAQAAGRAATRGLEAAQEDLATAERRRDLGSATDADVLGLSAHVLDLQQRVAEARGDRASAVAELRYLTGDTTTGDYTLMEPTDAGDERAALDAGAASVPTRPDVRRAAAAELLADTLQREARSALLPDVSFQSMVQVAGTGIGDRSSSWIIGGELRWTFSTGAAELARLKASAAAHARAVAENDDSRARAAYEITSASERLRAAFARRGVGDAAVAQSREHERIVRDRFDAGLATNGDVLRASSALLDAERQRASAVVDVLLRRAELDRARGAQARGEPQP